MLSSVVEWKMLESEKELFREVDMVASEENLSQQDQ